MYDDNYGKEKEHNPFVPADYDYIYNQVIEKEPELKGLIEYIRNIPNPTNKEYKQLLVDIKSDNPQVLETIPSRLMARYMKVAINIAYKYSEKHSTPLDETIQCALTELVNLCNDYVQRNNVNHSYTYINIYDNFYNYIHQNISRRLENEKSNLLNVPPQDTINSILKNRKNNLQAQEELLESDEIESKFAQRLEAAENKLPLLEDRLKMLKALAASLESEYRTAFEEVVSEGNRWFFFFDIRMRTRSILGNHTQELEQAGMTETGVIWKLNNFERNYPYQYYDSSIVNELIETLNSRLHRLIDIAEERLYNANHRIYDIEVRKEEQLKRIKANIGKLKGDIQLYNEISLPPLSIEEIVETGQEYALGIYDNEDLELSVFHRLLRAQLDDVLETLTPRETRILKLRFGLEDGRPWSLEEVGIYGFKGKGSWNWWENDYDDVYLSRERVRQIEAKALRKLRHPSRSKKLKDYLD